MWPTDRIGKAAFDAILLDVDNVPAAMATASNARLYAGGLVRLRTSLRPAGHPCGVVCARQEPRSSERSAPLDSRSGTSTACADNRRGAQHTILIASSVLGLANDPFREGDGRRMSC